MDGWRFIASNLWGEETEESLTFWTRVQLTHCPISRADSNFNMPTYAEHASLQRIKDRPLTRPLSPQNSHLHFGLSPSSYVRRWLALVYTMWVAGRTLSRERSNVELGSFSPCPRRHRRGWGLWVPHSRHVCDSRICTLYFN